MIYATGRDWTTHELGIERLDLVQKSSILSTESHSSINHFTPANDF